MNEILKKLRTLHNFSQSYVAEYLKISRQMYIKYESGEVEPSVKVVTDLCHLYKVSYDTILGEQDFTQEKSDESEGLYSALQSKAINQIKELSDFQIISVLAYMKLLDEEMAENTKRKYRKLMSNPIDPDEVEKINAVYDKIPKEEQLRFVKSGSKR